MPERSRWATGALESPTVSPECSRVLPRALQQRYVPTIHMEGTAGLEEEGTGSLPQVTPLESAIHVPRPWRDAKEKPVKCRGRG